MSMFEGINIVRDTSPKNLKSENGPQLNFVKAFWINFKLQWLRVYNKKNTTSLVLVFLPELLIQTWS